MSLDLGFPEASTHESMCLLTNSVSRSRGPRPATPVSEVGVAQVCFSSQSLLSLVNPAIGWIPVAFVELSFLYNVTVVMAVDRFASGNFLR